MWTPVSVKTYVYIQLFIYISVCNLVDSIGVGECYGKNHMFTIRNQILKTDFGTDRPILVYGF